MSTMPNGVLATRATGRRRYKTFEGLFTLNVPTTGTNLLRGEGDFGPPNRKAAHERLSKRREKGQQRIAERERKNPDVVLPEPREQGQKFLEKTQQQRRRMEEKKVDLVLPG